MNLLEEKRLVADIIMGWDVEDPHEHREDVGPHFHTERPHTTENRIFIDNWKPDKQEEWWVIINESLKNKSLLDKFNNSSLITDNSFVFYRWKALVKFALELKNKPKPKFKIGSVVRVIGQTVAMTVVEVNTSARCIWFNADKCIESTTLDYNILEIISS